MRIIGIILIVLGGLAIGYQGFQYVSRDTVVDAGPIKIDADRTHTVWIPPVVGGVAVVAGLAMLLGGGRRNELV